MTITNVKIVNYDEVIEQGYVTFVNGIIIDVNKMPYKGKDEVVDYSGYILMPGFIDIHTHGALGYDYMDASPKQMKEIADSLYDEGVTSILATSLTSDKNHLIDFAKRVNEAKKLSPSFIGAHLEGPYISLEKKGAQNPLFIRNADINELKEIQSLSDGVVKYITLAPEKEGSLNFIKEAKKIGVITSCGHTMATMEDTHKAYLNGLTNLTHTYNAMNKDYLNDGPIKEAFVNHDLYCEMIVDKIHVKSEVVKDIYSHIAHDHFILITDSLSVKKSKIKEFDMAGLHAENRGDAAYLCGTNTLAGSVLKFNVAVKNLKEITNASLPELVSASSYAACRSLHLDKLGEIRKNKIANFVITNNNFDVIATYQLGKKVY